MQNSLRPTTAIALALGLASSAHAYTPETGIWWNPAEPGTGLQIEIQDNFLALTGYVFTASGAPTFVTANGFLSDDGTRFQSTGSPMDGSSLNTFSGGQCLGCDYVRAPTENLGAEGPVTIVFDPADPTRAVITWKGRSTPIQRYQFYLVRPTDTAPVSTTKMLGEWNVVMDLSEGDAPDANDFEGDVLIIDELSVRSPGGQPGYRGCRPEDMIVGFCSDSAFASNDLAGFYDPATQRHMIVVTDSKDGADRPQTCLLYDVRVDTNLFEGGQDGDLDVSNDGGVVFYPCGATDVMSREAYPVRGFRSASRTFVEDGTGPNKTARGSVPDRFELSPSRAAAIDDAEARRRTQQVRSLEFEAGVR